MKINWIEENVLEELRVKASLETPDKITEINGIPIYKNIDIKPLEGEIFKKYKDTNIEVSNIGRIKLEDEILKQYHISKGYLYICLPYSVQNYFPYIPDLVYRLVAQNWVEKNDEKLNIVHHINNNGFDNNSKNLMWVNEWQHCLIHSELNIKIDKLNLNEMEAMIFYYSKINIRENEYSKIKNIIEAYKVLTKGIYNDEIENYFEDIKKKII